MSLSDKILRNSHIKKENVKQFIKELSDKLGLSKWQVAKLEDEAGEGLI